MTAKETANFVLDNLVHLNQNDKDNYLRRLIDLILKEDKELTALRAWKEHRLKDADPKIEHLVQTLGERVEILEAWKEKARPFLEESLKDLAGRIKYNPEMGTKKNREKHYQLTELLGGEDEKHGLQ